MHISWKMTTQQRSKAIRQYGLGISPTAIAKEFGVSVPAIIQLARRAGHGPRADVTAQICGDPLPGRSALDRVSIQHKGA